MFSIDNWQTAFRKQCQKRSIKYNPLGPEPPAASQSSTPEPDEGDQRTAELGIIPTDNIVVSTISSPLPSHAKEDGSSVEPPDLVISLHRDEDTKENSSHEWTLKDVDNSDGKFDSPVESKSWTDLSIKQKLVALHILTEWQFDNPHRLRQLMRDDGESGLWVCLH